MLCDELTNTYTIKYKYRDYNRKLKHQKDHA